MTTTDTEAQAPPTVKHEKRLPVVEVFGPTIQGEGLVAGQRTVFIRFGLCDYKCKMCDSMHAVDPRQVKENATWMTELELADKVLKLLLETNCRNVTYSGGNPCIHDLTNLTKALHSAGVRIALETQGTKLPDWAYLIDWITVSPKGPGMGEQFELKKFEAWVDGFAMDPHFCIKIVIFSAQDLEFASSVAEMRFVKQIMDEDRFYLSLGNPYPPGLEAEESEGLILQGQLIDNLDHVLEDMKGYPALARARFLPQVHVLLWGNMRGR